MMSERDGSVFLNLPDTENGIDSTDDPSQHPTVAPAAGAKKKKSESKFAKFCRIMSPWWTTVSAIACAIAVTMDPLFFYIPYIDDNKKCLGVDKRLKLAAIISRAITDITFLVQIICEINRAATAAKSKSSKACGKIRAFFKNLSWVYFVIDVLAILPIPQVLIVIVFFNMRGRRYLEERKAMNFFVLVQYLPRLFRIYLSSKHLRKSDSALWLKGAFNFFMYIIASHILGAFWYFYSIQRVTACWHQTYCKTSQGCATTYYCDDTALINIPLVNASCPVSPPDPEKYDFGMFSDGLKSGIAGPISFSVKLCYTVWWGLRNLSNFGTSLVTSTYVWENLFAILISVVGLILFSYLIGNMQRCMQMQSEKDKKEGNVKYDAIKEGLENLMRENKLDDAIVKAIMKAVRKKLEKDLDFDAENLENLCSILPWYLKKPLKRCLCMDMLLKVTGLKKKDQAFKMMYRNMKPVNYQENTMVFKLGKPLDRMIFIVEGSMLTYSTATASSQSEKATGLASPSTVNTKLLKKGDPYGKELLQFTSSSFPTALPASSVNARCQERVKAFVLMAEHLKSL